MLLNRAIERARLLLGRDRLLARRARARAARPPLVLIPSLLGVRLAGPDGRPLWGTIGALLRRNALAEAGEVAPAGLLESFPLVPRLWAYDVFGGLVRFLEDAGGYRSGEDLHVLEYDWRAGIAAGAATLADLVDRIRGAGDERVDLIGVSTGGLVARWYAAYGRRDALGDGGARPDPAASAGVRRVVHVGTPQRGCFSGLVHLCEGVQLVPLGRRFVGSELARCQTIWDALPHPDDRVFVDADGRAAPVDLYDAAEWRALGLAPCGTAHLAERLERARRLHRALDAAGAHPDTVVIGARHLPTRARMVVAGGRARITPCEPPPGDARTAALFEPGDSSVTESSLRGLPGLAAADAWFVTPREHRMLPADPAVHRLVLEALLATDRRTHRTAPRGARAPLPLVG